MLCCVPQEGVLLLHSLLRPGDHVVVMAPGYQSLHSIAEDMGCLVEAWSPRRADNGRLRFAVEDLASLIRPNTRLCLINIPHNPTGCVLSRAELDIVISLCVAHSTVLFSDEMYRGIGAEPPLPCAATLCDSAISLGGLSKTHGCPGLRSGWLVCRSAELMSRLETAKDFTTICAAAPSEILSVIALRASATIVNRNQAQLARNLETFAAFIAKHAHLFEFSPPAGGTVGWPKLLTGEPIDEFCERVLAGCGVLLLPSTAYDHVSDSNHFRVGFGRANFCDVLSIFDNWLCEQAQQ